jgi:hypothetical protein
VRGKDIVADAPSKQRSQQASGRTRTGFHFPFPMRPLPTQSKESIMKTRMTTSLIAGAMLLAGMAVSAQTAVTESASPGSNSVPGTSASSDSCQQMMDKAKPRVAQMSDATKMARAEKHMTTAQSNLDAGKTAGCESEMKQVMQLLN